jgi:hypothetical protein
MAHEEGDRLLKLLDAHIAVLQVKSIALDAKYAALESVSNE